MSGERIVAIRPASLNGDDQVEPAAVCLTCDWSRDERPGRNWLAIRAAARRHVRATAHPVSVSYLTLYRYVLAAGPWGGRR